MKIILDVNDLRPGADWQRLAIWAALADKTPMEYVRACVRRGHLELRGDIVESALHIRPATDRISIT